MKKRGQKFGVTKETKRRPASPPSAKIEAEGNASPRRRLAARIFGMLLIPLILLGLLEVGLRLAGYGYATGFLDKTRVAGVDYFVNNDNFSLRFFPPQLARWPGPVMFEVKKPAKTYRIFILGESAARGEPEPNYAASRYLQALLEEKFPQTHFEVINLGITAINSHVILPIARDCARADGDLWIVYMGNNEMVGPFGAATVFGAKALPAGLVRLNLAIQKTRVGQLLSNLARWLQEKNTNASWGGMRMFLGNQIRADDPRKETVYENFARNLDDILRAGLDSGAKILLNTVAVNLKDCPPFASLTNAHAAASEALRFQELMAEGRRAQASNDFTVASEKFEAAAKLDAFFPEAQFRWAECLARTGSLPAAGRHYQCACDADALPFRADSRINGAIAAAARKHSDGNVAFLDAASVLAAQTAMGVCGQETFFEHVHFNFDGEFRLGLAWAQQTEKLLPAEISRAAATNGWATQDACEHRLALTDWNRGAVIQAVMDRLHRPPLNGQLNNAERLQSLQAGMDQMRRRMNPATAQAAAEVYVAAIARAPGDYLLLENFAEFLESAGDVKQAAAQWKKVAGLVPQSCEGYYQAGRLLNQLDLWAEAKSDLTRAVTLRPRLIEGWYELGNADLGSGEFEQSLRHYGRAAGLDPGNATYRALIGKAFSKMNRRAEAMQSYRLALNLDPDLWQVHFALGDELAAANQFGAAKNEYAEVVRIMPGNAVAHVDLGVMQARLGLLDDSLKELEAALRLDPDNHQAREYLDRVRDWKRHRP